MLQIIHGIKKYIRVIAITSWLMVAMFILDKLNQLPCGMNFDALMLCSIGVVTYASVMAVQRIKSAQCTCLQKRCIETDFEILSSNGKQKKSLVTLFKKCAVDCNEQPEYSKDAIYRKEKSEDKILDPKLLGLSVETPQRICMLYKSIMNSDKVADQTKCTRIREIPFGQYSIENEDISLIRNALDGSYYGQTRAKESILYYMAARKHTVEKNSRPWLFVGLPGCGKSSFAQAVAQILNMEFVKVDVSMLYATSDLHGCADHWAGCDCGRIIRALIQSSTMNPVIFMDEIDKVADSSQGSIYDGLHTLFNVEDMASYKDQLLNESIDISRVLFIACANSIEQIPVSLLDRFEVIEFEPYDCQEVKNIIWNYYLPSQLKRFRLEDKVGFDRTLIDYLVSKLYDRNKSIREYQKQIDAMIRKACYLIELENLQSITMTMFNCKDLVEMC